MANAPDQVQKQAIKRLMQDLKEIQESPDHNVSAVPLDNNMFEWHCNFRYNGVVYHLILFFPKNYPYDSPSAEFVPKGYEFTGGATMNGKKGVKACLSIFADFAFVHTEWAEEKGMGWSPGYTVQTILMNLVSFLAETDDESSGYGRDTMENNARLAKNFTCSDCGHCASKPFPPFEEPSKEKQVDGSNISSNNETPCIVDYISKSKFDPAKMPKDRTDLYGFGLVKSGPPHRPTFTTPCEFISGESFFGMKHSVGKVHSMMKEELGIFLPLYLSKSHGSQIKTQIEASLNDLKKIMPNCDRDSLTTMVLKTIPNLMNTTVVEFSKGTQHTSDNHLNGYFALHRLFLWAIETYPELQQKIDRKLKEFIENESLRSKNACPNIGEWIMLLSGSSKYRWRDASDAYLMENWRRNVMWYVKDDAKLGFLDTDTEYRLGKTLTATTVSRKLLAFQVLFLDIAMPPEMTRAEIIERYDKTMGFPTPEMVKQMKEAVQIIDNMTSYTEWFKVLKLPMPSKENMVKTLVNSVEFAIKTDGYRMTQGRFQGGWVEVMRKYPQNASGYSGNSSGSYRQGSASHFKKRDGDGGRPYSGNVPHKKGYYRDRRY